MATCTDCPLHQGCMSVKIPMSQGSGPVKVLIIGEAPGAEEDKLAKPFVGEPGQLLRDALKEFLPPEVKPYITNAVKCRPPLNKLSGQTAIKECRKYLVEDVEAAHPDYIMVCGATPLQSLLGITGITKLRGHKLYYEASWGQVPVFPVFHPAYILRNIGMLDMWVDDMRRAWQTWQDAKPSEQEVPYTVTTMEHLLELATSTGTVVYDVETNRCLDAMDPNGFLTRIGFCTRYGDQYFVANCLPYTTSWRKDKSIVAKLLKDRNITKVGHNLKFDAEWSEEKEGIPTLGPLFDTQVAFYIGVNEEVSNSLKSLAYLYTPFGGYEDAFKEAEEEAPAVYPLEWLASQTIEYHNILTHYNFMDVVVTYMLFEKLKPVIDGDKGFSTVYYDILMPVIPPLVRTERRGIKIDMELLDQYDKELTKRMAHYYYEAWVAMLSAGIKGYDLWFEEGDVEGFLNKPKKPPKKGKYLNLGSHLHLEDILFKKLRLPVVKKTIGGKASSDKQAVELMYEQIERIEACGGASHIEVLDNLVKFRAVSTTHKMFIKPYAVFVDSNGVMHPKYSLTREAKDEYGGGEGTVTGRLSSAHPNFQQVPRVMEEGKTRLSKLRFEALKGITIKNLFISRFPNGKIVQEDYSQIELRWAAILSGDDTMIALFNSGADIHKAIAAEVFGVPIEEVTKEMRTQAKAVNFGILYGKGATNFAKDWGVSEAEAQRFIDKYFAKFPALKRWIYKVHSQAVNKGYVRTYFGRKRRLAGARSSDKGLVAASLREAQNTNPQASASDMTLTTIRRMDEAFTKMGLRAVVCGTVHDSIVVDCPDDELDIVVPTMKSLAEDWCKHKFPVPIVADMGVGDRWGTVKDMEVAA